MKKTLHEKVHSLYAFSLSILADLQGKAPESAIMKCLEFETKLGNLMKEISEVPADRELIKQVQDLAAVLPQIRGEVEKLQKKTVDQLQNLQGHSSWTGAGAETAPGRVQSRI